MGNKYKRIPKVGDLCIVWSKDPRRKWKKAIITDLILSADGLIRQCRIKMDKVESIRPVNQLYSLEITADEYIKGVKQQEKKPSVKEDIGKVNKVKVINSTSSDRPKRKAALEAIEKNRELMLEDHYFK